MARTPLRAALAAAGAAASIGLAASLPAAAAPPAQAGVLLDRQPRIAVISAFTRELEALLRATKDRRDHRLNGSTFTTGTLEGKRVVLFLSGVSMVNAAMNTQLALDRFRVSHVVFSGIAGGVDPALHIGDVSVPTRWASYLEATFARETTPGSYTLPPWKQGRENLPNFGMIHPEPVELRDPATGELVRKLWFDMDPALLATAKKLESIALARCSQPSVPPQAASAAPPDAAYGQQCLLHAPTVKVGGSGVSGQAFVDNAAFREYTFETFGAQVLDMESAAVAQVAWANRVPYIAFRSVSDLAGGGEGGNEIKLFLQLASDNSASVVRAFLNALELPRR
ncbi:MAG: phosphorylase [Aquabacterium sp.]|nr:MAG: phosphorylase [Aquabacterium sp.]